eukprot:m51a1_g2099 hypothetical protein (767) ;mRNA; f:1579856-1584812
MEIAHAALLVLCASAAAVLPAARAGCPANGAPVSFFKNHVRVLSSSEGPSLCPNSKDLKATDSNWMQLYVPGAFPWVLSSVCFGAAQDDGPNATARLQGEVSLYPVVVDRTNGLLRPGPRSASAPFVASLGYNDTWTVVQVPDTFGACLVWQRAAFIGVSWWSCSSVPIAVNIDSSVPGKLVWNEDVYVMKQVWGGSTTSAIVRQIALDADGHAPTKRIVNPKWFCDERSYGTNDGCNCSCGAMDPDCASDPRSASCPSDSLCDQSGLCVKVPWTSSECKPANYWAYDGCQCECGGLMDPDCFDPFQTASVCHDKFATPRCKTQSYNPHAETACYDAWKCNISRYGDGKVCDCECGIDPDCGRCPRSAPPEWKCDLINYADGKNCHCTCGTYDPDCDLDVKTYNCHPGEVCSYSGTCIASKCGDGIVDDTKELCDGGPGCTANCECQSGYRPFADRHSGCDKVDSKTTVIIAGSVGGGAALLLLCCAVAAIIYARKVKFGPRPLNVPIEVFGPAFEPHTGPIEDLQMGTFSVGATAVASGYSPSPNSGFAPSPQMNTGSSGGCGPAVVPAMGTAAAGGAGRGGGSGGSSNRQSGSDSPQLQNVMDPTSFISTAALQAASVTSDGLQQCEHPQQVMSWTTPNAVVSEFYDTTIHLLLLSEGPSLCPTQPDAATNANWMQLYVPERFPWTLSSICFGAATGKVGQGGTATVQGEVSLHPVVADHGGEQLRPGPRSTWASFRVDVGPTFTWIVRIMPIHLRQDPNNYLI